MWNSEIENWCCSVYSVNIGLEPSRGILINEGMFLERHKRNIFACLNSFVKVRYLSLEVLHRTEILMHIHVSLQLTCRTTIVHALCAHNEMEMCTCVSVTDCRNVYLV